MDLHPREGKYGHAAIFHLLKRKGDQAAVDCMLCNLPAASEDGTPALLMHSNVVTFFHEFGHIMHGLCAEGANKHTGPPPQTYPRVLITLRPATNVRPVGGWVPVF